ncbi:MAG: hypothetical protein HY720_17810 [Planctomycetes bacterium]|nr:hypothetical protein [Planctomycetota bacterium]
MSPTVRPFVELLPISLIISVVYCTMKEEGAREVLRAGAKFFLKLYGGVVLFSGAVFLLCDWVIR